MNKNWQIGIASHKGTKKHKNEDSHLHLISKDHDGNEIALFAVADGMGGYQVGDTASQLAISFIQKWWEDRIEKMIRKKHVIHQLVDEGEKLLRKINKTIIATGKHTGNKMGTTVSLLVLYKGQYGAIHIGDSRIYQMKGWNYGFQQYFHQQESHDMQQSFDQQHTELLESDPELIQLTIDHSWVGKKVEEGKLTVEQARIHPKRNVLTQCLGIESEITPYIQFGSYQSSDVFLVCSDGFHSLFSNKEIMDMLINLEKEYANLQSICNYLINFSNFSQAHDNITLLLIRNIYFEPTVKKKSFFSFLKS